MLSDADAAAQVGGSAVATTDAMLASLFTASGRHDRSSVSHSSTLAAIRGLMSFTLRFSASRIISCFVQFLPPDADACCGGREATQPAR